MRPDGMNVQEVIVIDPSVSDYKTLLAGLNPDIPVILLPASGDGLQNLADALAGYENLSAVHLVSHGSQGALQLGDAPVDSAALSANADALATIETTLAPGADLMLYGCSVANGEVGEAFVGQLSDALGVDIAASDDRTGPLQLGGDWELEYSDGDIETVLPFTVQGMQDIDHCLGCMAGIEDASFPGDDGTCSNNSGNNGNTDNTPTFVSGNAFNVDENTANGTVLHDVNANDGDGGASDSGLNYTITSVGVDTDNDGARLFSIDSSTGEITLNDTGDLDFEDGPQSYTLTVKATQNNTDSKQTSQTITVTVTDSGIGDTYDFESVVHNETSFTVGGQQFNLSGNMSGQKVADFGSQLVGQNGNSDGYMESSGTGNIGGFSTSGGETFRAMMFDVWPSTDAGGSVTADGQSITVIGFLAGQQVISETVTTFSYGQSPIAHGGAWQRIDLTGTGFLTTDIDQIAFSIGGQLNYLAVDNFVFDHLQAAPASSNNAPTLTNVDTVTGGTEDTWKEISLADLQALGDEADSDGTVDSFIIKAVSSGTLKIGTDVGSAVAWHSGNATLDSSVKLFWRPAADANGTLDAFTVVAVDDDGAESSTAVQVKVNTAAVNDAPDALGTGGSTVNMQKNSTLTFTTADVGYSDADGDSLDHMTLTTAPDAGTLWLDENGNGVLDGTESALTLGSTVTAADLAAGKLSYRANADEAGIFYTTVAFTVNDGTLDSVGPFGWDISVYDPQLDLNGDNGEDDTSGVNGFATYTDSDLNAAIDLAPDALLMTDGEDVSSMTIQISSGAESGDEIRIGQQLNGATVNGITISYDDSTNSITLTGDTYAWKYEALLQQLTFAQMGEDVSGGDRTVTVTATDINGFTGSATTITIDVAERPTATDSTVNVQHNGSHTFTVANFGYSDGDGDALAFITLKSLPTDGDLYLEGTAITSLNTTITQAQITSGLLTFRPDNGGSGSSYASFDFTVNDGNDDSAAENTLTLNVGNPPSPPTPPVEQETVDGVVVDKESSTENGKPVGTVTIDPVTDDRTDTDNSSAQADIPLHFDDGSVAVTTVSLPTGVGMVAYDNDTARDNNGLDDLLYLINGVADANEVTSMVDGGEGFLAELASGNSELWTNKLTLTASGSSALTAPVTITGSTSGNDKEALVIDASALPTGTVLDLQNVEFAVIVGEVTVNGGDGQNIVYAGTGSQTIILGADDDELHGGDGDDTVGSEGGDDLIFGDAGNDTLFGGAGSDQLHGGLDSDTLTLSGNRADYDVVQVNGVVTVTNRADNTDVETLINVEQIQFADQTDTIHYDSELEALATLYGNVLDRQADLDGFQWWADLVDNGLTLGGAAVNILRSAEAEQGMGVALDSLSVEDQVEAFYTEILGRASDAEGKAHWVNALNNGASLEQVAEGFVRSVELTGQYLNAEEWNFSV